MRLYRGNHRVQTQAVFFTAFFQFGLVFLILGRPLKGELCRLPI